MTAAAPTATACPARSDERPADRIRRTHRACLERLRTVVAGADGKDSGIWPRWNAVRRLDTFFRDRFDRERGAMDDLSRSAGRDAAFRLWTAGELVEALRWQLRHSTGLCH